MDGSTLSAKDKGAGEASPAAEAVGEHHVLTREELIAKVRAYHPPTIHLHMDPHAPNNSTTFIVEFVAWSSSCSVEP